MLERLQAAIASSAASWPRIGNHWQSGRFPLKVRPSDDTLRHVDPPVSESEAERIACVGFGIEATALRLPGERDQNFLLMTTAGARFVLKLSHSAEDPCVVDFETALLTHVESRDASIPVPRLVRGVDGAALQRTALAGCAGRLARVFTYVNGEALGARPRMPDLFRALGRLLARLHRAMSDFEHPGGSRYLLWDLQRFPALRPRLPALVDPVLRDVARAALDRFEREVLPVLPHLRRQVIHNDLNPSNVLVGGADELAALGLVDFGDAVHAPRIQDVAVAAAYAFSPGMDGAARLRALIDGYSSLEPLGAEEQAVLPAMVKARLAMTVVVTAWRASLDPGNSRYILRNAAAARSGLEALHASEHALERSLSS